MVRNAGVSMGTSRVGALHPYPPWRLVSIHMSPTPTTAPAWREPPRDYLARRPAEYTSPARPLSVYVTMRDGCRLAVDVYLPQAEGAGAPTRWPAIVILTPYYRRFAIAPDTNRAVEAAPGAAKFRDLLVPRGYALVVVDVRGTGASFGMRDSFRSPTEREDYRELADWIVRQTWSNGTIGATGISYVGAAALFLASTGHPAVKAIAPLFAIWDTWADHFYPGGLLLNRLAHGYDALMVALDHDRREDVRGYAYFADPAFAGPQPVDADPDGTDCRAAIAEHRANFRMPDFITEFKFRDDHLAYDPAFGTPSFSPYHYAGSIRDDVAILSVSGWMDGAGYANGTIVRFLALPNPKRHLLLGAWDHGARINVSPWRDTVEPRLDWLGELLRFFDEHLADRRTGLSDEAPIHYFTMHEEAWHAATEWPLLPATRRLYLAADHALADAPGSADCDRARADFGWGSGTQTRYERLAAVDTRTYYPDWGARVAALLSYDLPPLAHDAEISGHPVVTLWLAADQGDAALFVYLSEVEADGTVRYITEGVLRALHRAEAPPPRLEQRPWPYHPFTRAAAAPLVPGEPARLRFALLPTSWRLEAGSRLRLSIAGADADHYVLVPHGRPPLLTIHRGGHHASLIELPWRSA